ncbi:MAG TPA: phosphatidylserine decarboxylase family protein [Gemmatimonadales bacterium]|nr:phosphatidylserine decarboxylase family protein [Gemmatimonadales bacterium]
MMRIAREGRPFIIGAVAVLVLLLVLKASIVAAVWLIVTLWVIAFFRDPVPTGPFDDRLLLAPADGKVVSIIETDEPAFFGTTAVRVSIFMNVFDCHVNRYPAGGVVRFRDYVAGQFGHAADEKASLANEQSSVGIETPKGKMLVRQIAGLVARRIVTDHQPGQEVRQADRLGMIRFGSRVDLFLPRGTVIRVKVGDRTRVASTVVAEWT